MLKHSVQIDDNGYKQLQSYPLRQNCPNQYSIKIYIATFIHISKSFQREVRFERKNLRVRIDFQDEVTKERMYKAIQLHSNQISPFIQRYEHLRIQSEIQWKKLQIQAQIYQFTLKYILDYCQKNKLKLPCKSSQYLINCILEMYSYILYLSDNFDIQGLTYDPSIQNMGFNKQLRLILLYPSISKDKIIYPLKAFQKSINFGFRTIIKQTLIRLKKHCDTYRDFGLINFLEDCENSRDEKFISIKQQKENIKHFKKQLSKYQAIPDTLFTFINKYILTDQSQDPIIKYFKQEQRFSKCLINNIVKNRAQIKP